MTFQFTCKKLCQNDILKKLLLQFSMTLEEYMEFNFVYIILSEKVVRVIKDLTKSTETVRNNWLSLSSFAPGDGYALPMVYKWPVVWLTSHSLHTVKWLMILVCNCHAKTNKRELSTTSIICDILTSMVRVPLWPGLLYSRPIRLKEYWMQRLCMSSFTSNRYLLLGADHIIFWHHQCRGHILTNT